MRLWVEPAGRERKSANIEWKMVTLIYPYPYKFETFSAVPSLINACLKNVLFHLNHLNL